MTGLFCKRALSTRLYSAKETYNIKEPTNRSHPILGHVTHECDMINVCMRHFTHMNESHVLMAHTWMRACLHVDEGVSACACGYFCM